MLIILSRSHEIAQLIADSPVVIATIALTSMAGRTGRRIWAFLRPVAYWVLWAYLLLEAALSVLGIVDYVIDPDTVGRVYQNPILLMALHVIFGGLALVAIPYQAAGWRQRRFSTVAVGVFALKFCFSVADHLFDIIVICCG